MASITLALQNPPDSDTDYLLDTLLERSVRARKGGAAFAWATAAGVRLLIRDQIFERFALQYPFDLVVGTDSITNTDALTALSEAQAALPRLNVRAHLNPDPTALFHPKWVWFKQPRAGYLVTGSGNLTNGGLRGNWEAFTISQLDTNEINDVQHSWDQWIRSYDDYLRPLDDPQVQARAATNGQFRGPFRRRAEDAIVDDVAPVAVLVQAPVLIAELPRAANRWNQANFNRDSYENYFGARVGGAQCRILLQHVDANGNLGLIESRPSVQVVSRNWRFELAAAAGLEYPNNGRPTAVFVKVKPRTFVYHLFMPNEPTHAAVAAYLDANVNARGNQVRRHVVPLDQVQNQRFMAQLIAAIPSSFAD